MVRIQSGDSALPVYFYGHGGEISDSVHLHGLAFGVFSDLVYSGNIFLVQPLEDFICGGLGRIGVVFGKFDFDCCCRVWKVYEFQKYLQLYL
jgi:hypothetical protein